MPKAYWIATYRSINDPEALAEYAKLAGPAIWAVGGRNLVRGAQLLRTTAPRIRPHGSCWAIRSCETSVSSKAQSSVALNSSITVSGSDRTHLH
jgi:hypothetical protein